VHLATNGKYILKNLIENVEHFSAHSAKMIIIFQRFQKHQRSFYSIFMEDGELFSAFWQRAKKIRHFWQKR